MRFQPDFIQEVIDRTDIVSLIGRYVSLKRTGSNLVGRCPFHSEKTPSFSVSPGKRMFYCFGCHAGGSALTFVQKAENIEFVDAVEMLAKEAGVPLPVETGNEKRNEVGRKRVLEVNLEAAKYFRACLYDEKLGAQGLKYFKEKRALDDATIAHFGLGFAPDSFQGLTDYLLKKGFSEEELIVSYLAKRSSKGNLYDVFRNRVMFPIIDTAGNVVAFGGRVMDNSEPKYLNSSDTPAFKKSNHLFALNYAKSANTGYLILCEGYMDVIACHAAGFTSAVATLGTAITPNHAHVFTRYTDKVIISYDADGAGQSAATKAMTVLGEVGIEVRVIKTEGAKDPDEFIKKFGKDAFARLLGESKTGFFYLFDKTLNGVNLDDPSQKIKAINQMCSIIANYNSPIEREVYLDTASSKFNMEPSVLRRTVETLRRKMMNNDRAETNKKAVAEANRFGDPVNKEASKNPTATRLEESIIGMLANYAEYRDAVDSGKIELTPEHFVTDFYRRVFVAIMENHRSTLYCLDSLGEIFTPDEIGRIHKCIVEREQLENNSEEVFTAYVQALKKENEKANAGNQSLSDFFASLRQQNAELQ